MAETIIYLDHAATAPLRPEVLEAMLPYLREHYGNPSSLHRVGRRARQALNDAREQVAALIGADPREIVFTSGGTEADNLAIGGVVPRENGRIVTLAAEHHAVLHAARHWSAVPPVELPVDAEGRIDRSALDSALDARPALVSVMAGNNETGVLQPLEDIAARCRSRGVPFHTDAVQAVGYRAFDVREIPVDLLSLSAHKIGGPKGVGALYVRKGLSIHSLNVGGGQEKKRRAGTENLAAIVAFGAACALVRRERAEESRRMAALQQRLEEGILSRISDVWVNGSGVPRLPHITNVGFAGLEGEGVLYGLDAESICVSTGSACTSGETTPSHVLEAMGQPHEMALGAVRISLGHSNTEADVDRVLNVLPRVVQELRG